MPEISESELAALHKVAHDAAALRASVDHDENGTMIAGRLMGGNGGLVSRETLHNAGLLELSLNDLNSLSIDSKEG